MAIRSMKKQIHVGLDSQCYTYLIDAMAKLDEPVDDLAEQRIALFRIFLYYDGGLFISPTVRSEYQRIRSQARAVFHEEWTTLFPETRPINGSRMNARTIEFRRIIRMLMTVEFWQKQRTQSFPCCCRSIQNSFPVSVHTPQFPSCVRWTTGCR